MVKGWRGESKKHSIAAKKNKSFNRTKDLQNYIKKIQKKLDNKNTPFNQHADLLAELDLASNKLRNTKILKMSDSELRSEMMVADRRQSKWR